MSLMASPKRRPARNLTFPAAGRVIRQLREDARLSLADLAERVGWDKGRLSKYENDKIALSMPVIEEIAGALKKPPLEIVLACLKTRYPVLQNADLSRLLDKVVKHVNAATRGR